MCPSNAAKEGLKRGLYLGEVPSRSVGLPFSLAQQQSLPPSSLLQPACFSGRNSRVAASFFRCFRRVFEQGERCSDLPVLFFFFAQLSDWTISWVHRERGWGWEGGQPSSTLPPTRFHLKKCNANSVPKRHCSLRIVEGLNFAPMEWINPLDELRVRSLPLKSVFYLLVGCASAAWCCLMALLSMVKQVISYLFMLEPIPGATKKILHISLLYSLQLYWHTKNLTECAKMTKSSCKVLTAAPLLVPTSQLLSFTLMRISLLLFHASDWLLFSFLTSSTVTTCFIYFFFFYFFI